MFDFAWSEMAVLGVVALVVIGPKDLPKALKTAGFWVRRAKGLAREFQSSVDDMIRESELEELRKEAQKVAGVTQLMAYKPGAAAETPAIAAPAAPSAPASAEIRAAFDPPTAPLPPGAEAHAASVAVSEAAIREEAHAAETVAPGLPVHPVSSPEPVLPGPVLPEPGDIGRITKPLVPPQP